MPCYDPDPYNYDDYVKLRKKLDHVTDLLCWLCQRVEPTAFEDNHPLQEWWTKHQKDDAERLIREEKETQEKEMARLLRHAATLSPEELKRKLEP